MATRVETAPVIVAVCQVELAVGKAADNRAAAAAAVGEAAAAGARIVVLPELTPSGYVFADVPEAASLAEPADGPTAAEWTRLAADDLVIVGGFCELGADGRLYNSAMLVDRGGLRAVYRKAHLWDAERDFFTPGRLPPPVVATQHGKIAMVICYDAEFSEWVRLPALAGAELLAVPTNWPLDQPAPPGERPAVAVNICAAAFANRVFVAAACRCGDERGVRWTGASLIAGPEGYPLAGPASVSGRGGPARPVVLTASCDLAQARNKATGPRNDAHADRRPELYG